MVDLYAGVGYYTLPLLVHAHAKHIHACEWNPDSVAALRHNLTANRVADRCTVHAGDNTLSLPCWRRTADRVSLGLLPSSEKGWPLAAQALKARGGWLHVHDNVDDRAVDAWVHKVVACFESEGRVAGLGWAVECLHVERVKSYAPRIGHYVADVLVSTPAAAGAADTSDPAAGPEPAMS